MFPEPTPCGEVDPELFFDEERVAEAQAVCAGCPFIEECREFGKTQEFGVWGGVLSEQFTGAEARRLIKEELRADRDEAVLRMHHEGLSLSEIGRRLGVGHSSIRVSLDRALAQSAA